ncbi:hypothetical protein [Salinisphaera sp. G21_0]|uniref:hypothetical protein n=1 Tax=Salinisphaera sp. G21_0 TaxID=2821094 RepID=UPI001ADCD3B4|nr:hypothetical protein [Salinisphaera sp. G21_0]MBO9483038.1 hypothetical protein [Salinisphaera sp. G21_0]
MHNSCLSTTSTPAKEQYIVSDDRGEKYILNYEQVSSGVDGSRQSIWSVRSYPGGHLITNFGDNSEFSLHSLKFTGTPVGERNSVTLTIIKNMFNDVLI